jgi:hypothetical protein
VPAQIPGWASGGLVFLGYLELTSRLLRLNDNDDDGGGVDGGGALGGALGARELRQLEAQAVELLMAASRWPTAMPRAPHGARAVTCAGPSELRALGGHAGAGGYPVWAGEQSCHEVRARAPPRVPRALPPPARRCGRVAPAPLPSRNSPLLAPRAPIHAHAHARTHPPARARFRRLPAGDACAAL